MLPVKTPPRNCCLFVQSSGLDDAVFRPSFWCRRTRGRRDRLSRLAFLQVSTVVGWNSDKTAAENFLALLQDGKESMVVYDDGNKMEGSLYRDNAVIDAVRLKLSENPNFRLSCYFNFDDDMPFTQAFEGHPRVRIVTGRGDRPDDDVHYKIIDGGLKAHISRHEVASKERRYRVIDCTRVPRRWRGHVADVLLESHKAHASSVGVGVW